MPTADYYPSPINVETSTTPAAAALTPAIPPGASLLTGASLQVRNVSGGDITAISVDVSDGGTNYGPARTVTAGLPLAPGDALLIDVVDTEAMSHRVTLTADDDGVAAVDFLGEPAVRRAVTVLRVDGADEAIDGTSGATAPAFTGTAPTVAAVDTLTGTGYATSGQVVTTSDNQAVTLNQYAGCWLHVASQAPSLIVSHPAATGAPVAFTVFGLAPTTAAEDYRVTRAPTPAGTVASHTHSVASLS